MIIVSAADERFVPHFATMLHSAKHSNPTAKFYLLDCGITCPTRVVLEDFAERLGIDLSVKTVNMGKFDGLPTTEAYSGAIYARLQIPEIIPDDKAIYIDADTLIVGDLEPLWRVDLGKCLIAGVDDEEGGRYEYRKHGIATALYVNSGMLLMNLACWREENFGEQVISFIRCHPFLNLPDQTAINAMSGGRVVTVCEQWNFMLGKIDRDIGEEFDPRVIHCTGPNKPWLFKDAPFGAVYCHHRRATPFPMKECSDVYRGRVRRMLNLMLLRKKYWRLFALSEQALAYSHRYLAERVA